MHLGFYLAYSICCFLLNHVLQHHYFSVCKTSLASLFALHPSAYCHFVDKTLKVLQFSPIFIATPLIQQHARRAP